MILEACFKRRREGNKCCRKLKNKKIKGKSSLGFEQRRVKMLLANPD